MKARLSLSRQRMTYVQYSAEDFAADPRFIQWVIEPDPQSDLFWNAFMEQHPEKRELLAQAHSMVRSFRFRTDPQTDERTRLVWNHIQAANAGWKQGSRQNVRRFQPTVWSAWQRLAAALTAALLVATVLLLLVSRNGQTTYRTEAEARTVTLPDGSVVRLNAHSELLVSKNWDENREVWLDGEAFFSVRKKRTQTANAPGWAKFTVHAGTIKVEVLGTAFNVWQRQKQTRVVLKSGKVRLKRDAAAATVVMQPGDMVEMAENQSMLIQRRVDTRVYTAWKDDQLILNNTPLQEVRTLVEMQYGYRLQIADTILLTEKITFKPVRNDLDLLIKLLSEFYEVDINHTDKIITLTDEKNKLN